MREFIPGSSSAILDLSLKMKLSKQLEDSPKLLRNLPQFSRAATKTFLSLC